MEAEVICVRELTILSPVCGVCASQSHWIPLGADDDVAALLAVGWEGGIIVAAWWVALHVGKVRSKSWRRW